MIKYIKAIKEKGSPENDAEKIKTPTGRADLIDQLAVTYTQQKPSKLDSDIMLVTGFPPKQARDLAVRACKVFCVWTELFTKDLFQMPFSEFFEYGFQNEFISLKDCSLLLTQEKLLEALKRAGLIDSAVMIEINNLQRFKEYDLPENWTGTIRIETGKDKFHSIPAYNLNGEIKISDISYRGQRVNAFKYVTPANFRYFTSIKEA